MRKINLFLSFLLLFLLAMPVMAQDDVDCGTSSVNRQIDLWYNDYLGERGEFDSSQALEAAATFSGLVADLLETCEFAVTETDVEVEQTGDGSEGNPFIITAAGTVGATTINITEEVRPASELLGEAGVNNIDSVVGEGQEVLVIFLTVTCQAGAQNSCDIGDDAFRVLGDLGTAYEPTLDQYNLYLPASTAILGGSQRVGAIPFVVNADDTNLRLVYYPEGDALSPSAQGFYYIAQGTADSFIVEPTVSELIIRNGPNGAPVGALRSGQTANATGRTDDGEWVRIEAPEADGWVSAEFLDSDRDLDSLRVVDPDEDE